MKLTLVFIFNPSDYPKTSQSSKRKTGDTEGGQANDKIADQPHAGARPSSGAAISDRPGLFDSSHAIQVSCVAAPGDGRTPAAILGSARGPQSIIHSVKDSLSLMKSRFPETTG